MTQRIHLIDDDDPARESLAFLLATMGFEVLQYASAEQFLCLELDEPTADLLISDIRMPGLDGIELTRRLRQRPWSLPIVLISGHADSRLAQAEIDAGASAFLEKPYTEVRVKEILEESARRIGHR